MGSTLPLLYSPPSYSYETYQVALPSKPANLSPWVGPTQCTDLHSKKGGIAGVQTTYLGTVQHANNCRWMWPARWLHRVSTHMVKVLMVPIGRLDGVKVGREVMLRLSRDIWGTERHLQAEQGRSIHSHVAHKNWGPTHAADGAISVPAPYLMSPPSLKLKRKSVS